MAQKVNICHECMETALQCTVYFLRCRSLLLTDFTSPELFNPPSTIRELWDKRDSYKWGIFIQPSLVLNVSLPYNCLYSASKLLMGVCCLRFTLTILQQCLPDL